MTDYTELVKALRCGLMDGDKCKSCKYLLKRDGRPVRCGFENLELDAAAAIEALEAKVPHWVSVVQPPVVGQHIIVMDENEDMFTVNYDGNGEYEDEYGFFMEGILYWMPLPEPPKEES